MLLAYSANCASFIARYLNFYYVSSHFKLDHLKTRKWSLLQMVSIELIKQWEHYNYSKNLKKSPFEFLPA